MKPLISFNDVAIYCETVDENGSNRNSLYEYINGGYDVEANGVSAKSVAISGYIVGSSISETKEQLKVLFNYQTSLTVKLLDNPYKSGSIYGNYNIDSYSFSEDRKQNIINITVNMTLSNFEVSSIKELKLQKSLLQQIAQNEFIGKFDSLLDSAGGIVKEFDNFTKDVLNGVDYAVSYLANINDMVDSLQQSSGRLANGIANDIYNVVNLAKDIADVGSAINSVIDDNSVDGTNADSIMSDMFSSIAYDGPSDDTLCKNKRAFSEYLELSILDSFVLKLNDLEFSSKSDATKYITDILEQIEYLSNKQKLNYELFSSDYSSDNIIIELQKIDKEIREFSSLSGYLKSLPDTKITKIDLTNSIILSYKLYGDISRVDELAELNFNQASNVALLSGDVVVSSS